MMNSNHEFPPRAGGGASSSSCVALQKIRWSAKQNAQHPDNDFPSAADEFSNASPYSAALARKSGWI